MVLLTPTTAILSAVNEYNALPPEYRGQLIQTAALNFIDHHLLQRVSECLLKHLTETTTEFQYDVRREKCTLNQLLRGCSIYVVPKLPREQPTEEYKALMTQLRRQAEEQSYKTLLTGFETHTDTNNTAEDEYTLKDLQADLSIIANVLFTTIGTGGAVWAIASSWATPERLAMAFTTSLLVCVAEVALLWDYYRKIGEAKKAEKNKLEKKEILNTWVIGNTMAFH